MAEEAIVAADSPAPLEHKRKHEDGETEALEPSMGDSNAVEKAAVAAGDSEESEAKRPRAEEQPDELVVTENGFQEQKVDEPVKEDVEPPSMDSVSKIENAQESIKEEASEMVNKEQTSNDDHQIEDIQQTIVDNAELENSQQQPYPGVLQDASAQVPQQGDISSSEQKPASDTQTTSQKIEVPNNKVGVLIGKAGDTIRFLQKNSGAKIQITRDADTDLQSTTRAVELIGTPDNIIKAEKLIQDVIAEADAGGSPSLVARGFSTVQAAGAAEQILIQVPNEKVGVIIGKGGETIKSLQTRSGARIQLIPQHLPEGDQSKERTVRVSGDKKQIEIAREMIKEVMTQPARQLPRSGGYNQQGVHPRGAPSHWGSRSPHPAQPTGYEYHRGPYPSQNSQYPPQGYGNYPQQQAAPRSSLVPGMGQRPQMMQGPPLQGDYYGGQGRMLDTPKSAPPSNAVPAHGPGPSPVGPPPSYGNYNYGQHGTDYGLQAPYSQIVPSQNYGHGYNEAKYENQAPSHQPHVDPQQMAYPQVATYPGYNPQDQYGKPSYAVPPHGPPSQSYVQPRAGQPADVPYQGPVSSTQPYGQTAPAQQAYPFPPSGHMQQQTYPPYASAAASEGYIQQTPVTTASGPVYPQQGGQPVAGYYGQPGGQQAPGYAQVASQPAQNSSGYGYHQGAADPAYASGSVGGYSAAAAGQAVYVQPAPPAAQPGYVQYDSTQMYGAHH